MNASPTQPRPLPPGPRNRFPLEGFIRARVRGLLVRLDELKRDYGDVVFFRIAGRPFALVSEPELIRRIVVTDNALFTKSAALAGAKNVLGEGLLTSEPPLHSAQRRMIGPVFHAQRVKAYGDDFVVQAKRMSESWQGGQRLDLGHEMTELTLRVVTQSLFGVQLEDEVRPIGRDMETLVSMFERARNPLAFLLDRLPLPANRRFRAALNRLDDRIGRMIEAREKSPDDGRNDLLSLLLMARDEGGRMTPQQVRDEAVTLFMAGHETTANALIWTWLFLADHPEAEALLHTELDDVLPNGRPATADDVPKLRYTRAVLAESMRLRPPAWVIARACKAPYDLGEYQVPAGTTILMSQYLVHRDPRWWLDAETFRPSRWILDDAAGRPKYAYFPFGGGSRSCVGEPFAWMEAILLLATLAQRWRLERTSTAPVRLFPTITLRPKDTVVMTAHLRRGW